MTPPGWYPDGAGQVRFWDGAAWTGYTSIPAFDAIGRSDPRLLPPPGDPAVAAAPPPPASPVDLPGLAAVIGFGIGALSVFLPFLVGLVGGLIGLALSVIGTAGRGTARRWAIAGIAVSVLAIVLLV